MSAIDLGGRLVGDANPTLFIADIAANHDGSLGRAVELIHLAAEAGADVAKFQNFKAERIVSDFGFRSLPFASHQKNWKKSVFEVYQDASVDDEWTAVLAKACREAGILYATTPYDPASLQQALPYMPFVKIGSGDINWSLALELAASSGKPVFLATGASTFFEVRRAVQMVLARNSACVLMQCNTNYTGSKENFAYVNLRVIETFRQCWPDLVLGFSDHTPGHAAVLGAVALGAKVIEKHFTDDTMRDGPDHPFSMTPATWREMVERTRELEAALGDGVKRVETNERETVILQRRALRATRFLPAGTVLVASDLAPLRPCPTDAWPLTLETAAHGAVLLRSLAAGDCLLSSDIIVSEKDGAA